MDLIDKLSDLAKRVNKQRTNVKTEEAAKTAFVLPFLQTLGYDIFDPDEVIPEYTADVLDKKGEKVDYAIQLNEKIQLLIECKQIGSSLEVKHAPQLYRYFSTLPDTRFGVLTDGIRYLFFSDLDKEHVMDKTPFFEFSLDEINDINVEELKRFSKVAFNLDEIRDNASKLKYQKMLKDVVRSEFEQPSEGLVRLWTKRVYEGNVNSQVKEQFTELVRITLKTFINESVRARLETAYQLEEPSQKVIEEVSSELVADSSDNGVVTTEQESDAFRVVCSIVSESIDPDRVFIRDSKSYCSVLLDDNNRKGICRFFFGKNKSSVVVFTANGEEKFEIEKISDIYKHKALILSSISQYE